jgi:hypothetical protein
MNWKELAPYFVPVLVLALLARRVMKAQKPRAVRPGRLWVFPAILLLATIVTLAKEPAPGLLAMGAFFLAAVAGGSLGWFRVHTLEFNADPETGAITSKATPLGAFLIVGLLLARYGIKYIEADMGVTGSGLARWADGGLIFSAVMMIAQSVHTWVRARKLLTRPALAGATVSSSEK